jgi:putative secretion ATPase (PEP-CTERM system associated)
MYESHFSFKHKPFELIPNPDFLFLSSTHKKAITYLDYGIKEKTGFILLTGEIGSGKTTIIRNLIKNLNGSVKLSRVHNTKVSSDELIAMINEDFGLQVEGKSKVRMLGDLNHFLIDMYSKKVHPILLIDEAQNLSPELLEEIRLLSNLETDRSKLLQIILVGQPELKKTLALPEMMQLRQRININYHLSPLSLEETALYIRHRLQIAGNPEAFLIDNDLVCTVYEFSRGIPRLINIICDFALLAAYADGSTQVTADIVRDVMSDLENNEYWVEQSERHGSGGPDPGGAPDTELGNALMLRLLRMEEVLNRNVGELSDLSSRMDRLENAMSHISEGLDEELMLDLLHRMEDKLACRILLKISEENHMPELLERIQRLESGRDTSAGGVIPEREAGYIEEVVEKKMNALVDRLDELYRRLDLIRSSGEVKSD